MSEQSQDQNMTDNKPAKKKPGPKKGWKKAKQAAELNASNLALVQTQDEPSVLEVRQALNDVATEKATAISRDVLCRADHIVRSAPVLEKELIEFVLSLDAMAIAVLDLTKLQHGVRRYLGTKGLTTAKVDETVIAPPVVDENATDDGPLCHGPWTPPIKIGS